MMMKQEGKAFDEKTEGSIEEGSIDLDTYDRYENPNSPYLMGQQSPTSMHE